MFVSIRETSPNCALLILIYINGASGQAAMADARAERAIALTLKAEFVRAIFGLLATLLLFEAKPVNYLRVPVDVIFHEPCVVRSAVLLHVHAEYRHAFSRRRLTHNFSNC